ncbi:zinc finger protein 391-like [Polypterus senegalus]|uniref:zinc finger protein 391-like n=1 Tax=Polypterus senegalus TaxID=55291 RepID=UPI001965E64B|nr:zinc finger protein 391-like [Polypterus senegalus]
MSHHCPRLVDGSDTKVNLRFSPSLPIETSHQDNPQQTPHGENMKKSTSGSKTLKRSFLQINSHPIFFFISNNPQRVNSANPEAVHVCQEQKRSLKCQIRDNGSQQNNTSQRIYGCSECGKGFTRRTHLKSHTIIHTGEKPYCCAECGKGLSSSGGLKSLKRTHTGEKPHRCSKCGKYFSRDSSLQEQKRIHICEKTPFLF